MTSQSLGESIGLRLQNMATKNHLILTYLTIFSQEGIGKICCHCSVFLIRHTPTHDNSLGVDLKISIFWFACPTIPFCALVTATHIKGGANPSSSDMHGNHMLTVGRV